MTTSKKKAFASGTVGQEDLDSIDRLGLREEDLDDVVFEEEDPPPAKDTSWMAISQVHMEHDFYQ